MNISPSVTLIVVCYNQARFVQECLEGVRSQTYKNTELIIVDDFSTDNSVDLINEWILKNKIDCHFIAHTDNQGLPKSLNEALSHSSGKYVSMTAADDVWLPQKIEIQVEAIEKLNEDVGVVYSDAIMIDEAGNSLPEMFISYHGTSTPPQKNILARLIDKNRIPAPTTLIRRNVYERVGFYDPSIVLEDWSMWLKIAKYYRLVFLPNVATKYRLVNTSLNKKYSESRIMRAKTELHMWSHVLRDNPEYRHKIRSKFHQLTAYFDVFDAEDKKFYLKMLKQTKGLRSYFLYFCFKFNGLYRCLVFVKSYLRKKIF